MPEIDVRLERVTKTFGDAVAVDDLSLDIAEGEFFSLLGPSGCGKTTTLRMIGGFEEPSRGTVYLGGRDVTDFPPYKRDVNTVFQSYALFPHLDVFENVAFGLRRRKVPKSEIKTRVDDALRLVEMGGFGNRKPGQMSGGQQQRGRSWLTPNSCSSTNHSGRLISSCASRCRSSSSGSSRRSGSRSST